MKEEKHENIYQYHQAAWNTLISVSVYVKETTITLSVANLML